jgi:cytochrome c oxidase cbb3-type subunit 4
MSGHSTYEALRHFADSWGLLFMVASFLVLVLWPFRPGARERNAEAKTMIFRDDEYGE